MVGGGRILNHVSLVLLIDGIMSDFKFNIGDLLIGNADSININMMLIVGQKRTHYKNCLNFDGSTDIANMYIIYKNGKNVELKEDIILRYIDSGKIKVIKRDGMGK